MELDFFSLECNEVSSICVVCLALDLVVSWVVLGFCLSSCSRGNIPLVELCVEPAGFSGRCTGVLVTLLLCLHPGEISVLVD